MQICEDARKSGEAVICEEPQRRKKATKKYLIFFHCFRAIRMTGEKVPDKDIHISLEVLHQLQIRCVHVKLQSEFSICNMISFQDQQKINKFARQNQKLEDIKDDIKVLLEEASLINIQSYL